MFVGHRPPHAPLQDRLHAEFWYLPEDAHAQILADTRAWIEAEPGGWDAVDRMDPYLTVEAFRTPGEL